MASKMEMGSIPVYTEEVAIFSKPPINVGEEKISWVEYRPSFITQGGYSSVQFYIPGNSTQYVDLNRNELYVKLKIVKEDGTPFDSSSSMWSSVNVKLNHTLVSSSGTNYMYKALLENLLNYDADAK